MRDYNREIAAMLYTARMRKKSFRSSIPEATRKLWESGERIPPLKRVTEVARDYGLKASKFRAVLEKAHEQREAFRKSRVETRKESPSEKSEYEMFPGELESPRVSRLLNKRLNND